MSSLKNEDNDHHNCPKEDLTPDSPSNADHSVKSQPQPAQPDQDKAETEQQTMARQAAERFGQAPSNKIFVVLCEREEINKDCLSVIQQAGLQPVILYPDHSDQTIEQKFMTHPRVHFAFVILSGDDFVYDRVEGKPAEAVLCAKQPAVFHLGYLLGKFGRLNTFIVYREQRAYALPTVQHNAIFIPYEKNGRWVELFQDRLNKARMPNGS
ncbi:MAG: TIR domain-containing protein [Candidatus Omnitrophota bacterium]